MQLIGLRSALPYWPQIDLLVGPPFGIYGAELFRPGAARASVNLQRHGRVATAVATFIAVSLV